MDKTIKDRKTLDVAIQEINERRLLFLEVTAKKLREDAQKQ